MEVEKSPEMFHICQKEIVFNENAKNLAIKHYQRQQRTPVENHTYFYVPESFTALENPVGFAPSLIGNFKNCTIMCLPGVPREFDEILKLHLPKYLTQSTELFEHVIFKTHE